MITYLEPLTKAPDRIDFVWKPEPGAFSYNMYVGLSPTMTLLYTGISASLSRETRYPGKIFYTAMLANVASVLGLSADKTFENTVFYFTITYLDSVGAESPLSGSTIVKVYPVGIHQPYMKDDPTINRHPYVFSEDLQRWVKAAGSSTGALVTTSSDFYSANVTTEYTYDGTNLSTSKSYPSDATTGDAAKLITYTYTGSQLTKTVVTDTTV